MIETHHPSQPTEPPSIATSDEVLHAPSFLLDELACPPRPTDSRKHGAPPAEQVEVPVDTSSQTPPV